MKEQDVYEGESSFNSAPPQINELYKGKLGFETFLGLNLGYNATLDIMVGEYEYSCKLIISKDEKGQDVIYSNETEGAVRKNRLFPNKAKVYSNYGIVPIFAVSNKFTFDFGYSDDGKLVKLSKTENGSTKDFDTERYDSHTDFLTSLIQQLLDLRNNRNINTPVTLEFIDHEGVPIAGSVTANKDRAEIELKQRYYFDKASVSFGENYVLKDIFIKDFYLRVLKRWTYIGSLRVIFDKPNT